MTSSILVPSLGILLFNQNNRRKKQCLRFSSPLWGFFYLINIGGVKKTLGELSILVPSLGILLFNTKTEILKKLNMILVPSLGILLFNSEVAWNNYMNNQFSSPLWGFFYLIDLDDMTVSVLKFSSPLWGFFYLISNEKLFNSR